MTRVLLFIATNIAVLLVLSVVLNILMPALGLSMADNTGLLVFAAVLGMGGSFISLAMSKSIAKRSVGAHVIDSPRSQKEAWLVDIVRRQADRAGIGMPEVAVYDSPDINAFATGANRNNALVAVSSGLLRGMTDDEAEAVLGHEVSHIANGDMVTMTLLQGVLNTFVIFFARIVAGLINRGGNNAFVYFSTVMLLQMVFGVLASVIIMGFSRWREYRADKGGANLAGRMKMIAALRRLQGAQAGSQLEGQLAAFGINGRNAFAALFSSHPPLEKRIAALQEDSYAY